MWSKWFLLVALSIPFAAQAEEDWHPETVTFEVKEKTRFYQAIGPSANKGKSLFLVFELPVGLTLNSASDPAEFLKGKWFAEAEEETLAYGILEKDGKKRRIEISLGGGVIDFVKYPNMKTLEGRQADVRRILFKPYGFEENLDSGQFEVDSSEGFFVRKKWPSPSGNHEYFKIVSMTRLPCGFSGYFRELDPTMSVKKYIAPQDWLFEGMFDEIMRSMRCEEVPTDYLEKWNKEQEAKRAAKQASAKAKAAQPKKSAKPKK